MTVDVGAGDSGLAFSPVAIHVDNGTTVEWEWTGEGGAHNVVAENGTFESVSTMSAGTEDYTFEDAGVYQYHCEPHEAIGMKGQSSWAPTTRAGSSHTRSTGTTGPDSLLTGTTEDGRQTGILPAIPSER